MLVCHMWLPRSQHNYYDSILDRNDVLQIAKFARGSQWKGKICVIIYGDRSLSGKGSLAHLATFAAMLAGKWTRVKRLYVQGPAEWRPSEIGPGTFLDISTFSSLTNLNLHMITFPNVATFGHLVCSFVNLKDLWCSHLTFLAHHPNPLVFPNCAPRMQLHKFSIVHAPIFDIAHFLTVTKISTTINTMRVGWDFGYSFVKPYYASGLQHLLRGTTSLRDVQLELVLGTNLDGDTFERCLAQGLDLSHNRELQSLRLIVYLDQEDADLRWMAEVLSRVISDAIHRIQIEFTCRTPIEVSLLDIATKCLKADKCTLVEEAFMLPVFAELNLVEFELGGHAENHAVWSKTIADCFPRLYERGILFPKVRFHLPSPGPELESNEA